MSPIVHAELSWLLAQGLTRRRDRILVSCAGVAPDLDGLSLLAGLDAYGKYHHFLTHGLAAAAVCAAICGALARSRLAVAALAFTAFHLHLLCDLAGSGPGWPILYWGPFARTEWYWSGQWPLSSWQNGVIGAVATLVCFGMALPLRRTPAEWISTRLDGVVVRTIRRRFGRLAPVE